MAAPVLVFGPSYLDRVLRVDRSLVDPAFETRPLDASVDMTGFEFGEGLSLFDTARNQVGVRLPEDWPGPFGSFWVSRPFSTLAGWSRFVSSTSWCDDLGGMGSGFAASLGGELISVLGPESDPTAQTISRLLSEHGIKHHPIRVDHPSDWTLLITSGEHGDKLPIGFRGAWSKVKALGSIAIQPCHVRVVASIPNRLAGEALRGPSAIRVFAPAMRNMVDREVPVADFTDSIDILCCNRGEWESLADREEVASRVAILAVTDGPNGASIQFTTPEGEPTEIKIPAFPRTRPPVDTNRAGEAFASMLVGTLIKAEWTPGGTCPALARRAAIRASAAAALVLDRPEFGFPTAVEVDRAIRAGRVG